MIKPMLECNYSKGKEQRKLEKVKDMKIRKRAEQKNFIVNRDMYTLIALSTLCKSGYIFCYEEDKPFDEKVISSIFDISKTDIFRIYACDCTDVTVVYNSKYGFYENVVKTYDGTQISIIL